MAQKKKGSARQSNNTGKKGTRRRVNARSSGRRRSTSSKSTRGGTRSRRSTTRKSSGRSRKSSRRSQRSFSLNLAQKALIAGIGIVFITAILVLSLMSPNQGQLTSALSGLMWRTFGWGGLIVPLVTGSIGLYLVLWGMEQPPELPVYRLLGFGLLYFTFEAFATLVLLQLDNGLEDVWAIAQAEVGGGYVGGLLAYLLTGAIGNLGAVFTLVVTGLLGTILLFGVTRADMGALLSDLFAARPSLRRPAPPFEERDIAINPGRSPQRARTRPTAAPPVPEPEAAALKPAGNAEPEPAPQRRRRSARKRPTTPAAKEDTPSGRTPTTPAPIFLGSSSGGSGSWTLPRLSEMLEAGSDQDLNSATIREQVEVIEHTLESFGAPATVVEINQGPAITQYGVEPNFIEQRSGKRTKVKVGKIASLADDLALALAAQSIRIQAPVPGKGYVGIEVPNVSKALVSLRDVMESPAFTGIKSSLRIGLGQNVAGQPIAADLAGMPHLLIAGTTGSGKSVCVNSIIACLLLQNTPDQLKLVMVDPKRVELTGYNGIPHLAAPVVVDMERVIGTLQWAMREMDNRYKRFAEVGARNINDYNKKIKNKKDVSPLPHIVIIIDELADLMMLSPEETERGVTRLAQMARATGIHMVIATQRPSVDVVTGLIKANFPARIAFAVASSTDSRVILDTTGAERLLGQGDMLFQSPEAAAPIRLQGCFVGDSELVKLIEYWKKARRFNVITAAESVTTRTQAARPQTATDGRETTATEPAEAAPVEIMPDEAPTQPTPQVQQPLWEELQKAEEKAKFEDELMPEAIALVRQLQKASTSLLQRRFRIGYTRAARLIDTMEEQGIIGPPTGTSKARKVLLPKEDEETNNKDSEA
ncbi:MAG: DNA translocase FtsK 4TM domain-containing protein [Anaerolineae bacterium]